MSINMNGSPVVLANIYAPNDDNPQFYLDVFAYLERFDQSCLIVGGDLNLVLGDLDYSGSRVCHSNVRSRDMVTSLIEEFNLVDVWRHCHHPNLRQYTHHQHNPKVIPKLGYILVSDNLMGRSHKSKILPGVNSDHSLVQLIFWDAFKCTISGFCIEYTSRKKKERTASKINFITKIAEVNNNLASGLDADAVANLTKELNDLEAQLNKIVDFETEGLITRSCCRWVEEGERSSKYFCNLEKRMSEKKSINRIRTADQSIATDKFKVLEKIQIFDVKLYSDTPLSFDSGVCKNFLESLNIPKLSDENNS